MDITATKKKLLQSLNYNQKKKRYLDNMRRFVKKITGETT